ncbi:hypothetical protein AGDE_08270 [Angomonas deanei]|nr:hypothetical protein AGDE_08270 [Angomonas deanei]|eukprot:EPY33465.1 hypothetical protein AGDE_08270 [Angomonas deanei]
MKPGILKENKPTAASSSKQLPPYILTSKDKLQQEIDATEREEQHNLANAIRQLTGHSAALRGGCDTVEGSVLVLGVDTAHSLITTMTSAKESMEQLPDMWQKVAQAQGEIYKQWNELFDSLTGAYFSLRQRNESLERELQQHIKEQDSREAALDQVTQYLHSVIAERARWQAQQGPNRMELPMEEESFTQKTGAALDALYAIRQGGGTQLPLSKVSVHSVDSPDAVADRWRSTEDARHALLQPSSRLHYIPPEEEVNLLRSTLAMGTGSSMLMLDIQRARQELQARQKEVSERASDSKKALQQMRKELMELKQFMIKYTDQRLPFLAYKNDILRLMQERVSEEVDAALRGRMERDPNIRGMEGGYPWNAPTTTEKQRDTSLGETSTVQSLMETSRQQEVPLSEEEIQWQQKKQMQGGSLISVLNTYNNNNNNDALRGASPSLSGASTFSAGVRAVQQYVFPEEDASRASLTTHSTTDRNTM